MSNVDNVTHEDDEITRITLNFPRAIWKEVKKAAIDANKSAQQYVIDLCAEKLGAAEPPLLAQQGVGDRRKAS